MPGVEKPPENALWPDTAQESGGPNMGGILVAANEQQKAALVTNGLEPMMYVELLARKIADEIARDNWRTEQPWTFVVIMDGGIFFAVDLIRELEKITEGVVTEKSGICFIRAFHYVKTGIRARGGPHVKATSGQILTRNVLIIDDICDTGLSIDAVRKYLLQSSWPKVRPDVIKTVTLLKREEAQIAPNYWGVEVPKGLWALGYGMNDDDQSWRCTRHISFVLHQTG